MAETVTDRRILKAIHDRYYSDFTDYSENSDIRSSKIYVPIDCKAIGSELNIDSEIIFGRLYYHLDNKYGYIQDDGSKVNLFALKVGSDMHTVNFPMLSAVLAEYEQSYYRFLLPIVLSSLALTISIVSFVISNGWLTS